MSCADNWYEPVYYEGEIFAVLQPKKMICQNSSTGEDEENTVSPWYIEFAFVMLMQLYFGSLIIMFILARSCSRKKTDAFRLVFIYLVGTVGFALALTLGPIPGGFTRLLGWGVMIHNCAEWFIISRLWFGEKMVNALPALFYLITFVIIITLVPLVALWFIGLSVFIFLHFSFYLDQLHLISHRFVEWV